MTSKTCIEWQSNPCCLTESLYIFDQLLLSKLKFKLKFKSYVCRCQPPFTVCDSKLEESNLLQYFHISVYPTYEFLTFFSSSPSARSSQAWRSVEPGAVLTSSTVLTCLYYQLSQRRLKHCKTHSATILRDYR